MPKKKGFRRKDGDAASESVESALHREKFGTIAQLPNGLSEKVCSIGVINT